MMKNLFPCYFLQLVFSIFHTYHDRNRCASYVFQNSYIHKIYNVLDDISSSRYKYTTALGFVQAVHQNMVKKASKYQVPYLNIQWISDCVKKDQQEQSCLFRISPIVRPILQKKEEILFNFIQTVPIIERIFYN